MDCDQNHDHGHDHRHDDSPIVPVGMSPEQADTASRSLSEALSWSFKLLTGLIILVLIGFLATGVKIIGTNKVGLVKVFGRIIDEAKPGLAITWPFPIGEIEVVSTKPNDLTIEDFWMFEPLDQRTKTLSERVGIQQGLRPGWDGALFTGDKSLVHVKLECRYTIDSVRDLRQAVPAKYIFKDSNREDLVVEPTRSAICEAAIKTAAVWTADRIQFKPGDFLAAVREAAQNRLTELHCGIRILNLTIPREGITLPLAVRPMYNQAQAARTQKDQMIAAALTEAGNQLNGVAGGSLRKVLVGDNLLPGVANESASQPAEAGDPETDLIGEYNKARDQADRDALKGNKEGEAKAMARAERLLARIDDALTTNAAQGDVDRIIRAAATDVTTMKQALEGRTQRFDELYAQYRKDPKFMMESLWAQARQDILNDPRILKYYVNTGNGKTVITINHDPDFLKDLQRQWSSTAAPVPAPAMGAPPMMPPGPPPGPGPDPMP